MALALGVALPAGYWLSPERWAWAFLAALLVFYGTDTADDVLAKGWHRVRGTVVGGALGLGAADVLQGDPVVEIVAILTLQFLAVWFQPFSYTLSIAATTALLALFLAVAGQSVPALVGLRFEETLIGAAAGFLAARTVYPAYAGTRARRALARLLDDVATSLEGAPCARDAERRLGPGLARLQGELAATRRTWTLRPGGRDVRAALRRRSRCAALIVHETELYGALSRTGGEGRDARAAHALRRLRGALDALVRDEGALMRERCAPDAPRGPDASVESAVRRVSDALRARSTRATGQIRAEPPSGPRASPRERSQTRPTSMADPDRSRSGRRPDSTRAPKP